MSNGDKCLRCGRCCINGDEKCQYLIQKEGKKAYCRIWKTHAGHSIGKKTKGVCLPRILDDRIIEGCPYNEDILKRIREFKEAGNKAEAEQSFMKSSENISSRL